jgi:hypothetical protein
MSLITLAASTIRALPRNQKTYLPLLLPKTSYAQYDILLLYRTSTGIDEAGDSGLHQLVSLSLVHWKQPKQPIHHHFAPSDQQ